MRYSLIRSDSQRAWTWLAIFWRPLRCVAVVTNRTSFTLGAYGIVITSLERIRIYTQRLIQYLRDSGMKNGGKGVLTCF